jgi:ATP-dependent protease ClpP protease subunit
MSIRRLPTAKAPVGYRVMNRGKDAGEIYLYGAIGASFWGDGISADQFRNDLKSLGPVKTIDVRINSEGGDVFDGKAMYSLLVEHPANVIAHIDGLAASAASFIAMAANEIEISEGAFVMIHNASGACFGGADDMRRTADLLETVNGTIADVYASRTKQPMADIRTWMDAETWMTGKEAVANGFADKMVANLKVAASVTDPSKFHNLPAALRPKRVAAHAALAGMKALIR